MEKIYLRETEDKFLKYKITYNEEELRILRERILKECCPVIPHKMNLYDEKSIRSSYGGVIRSIERGNYVKTISFNDFYSSDEDVYEYTYAEYLPSKFVIALNNLLDNNGESFEDLFHPSWNDLLEDIKQQVGDLSKKIDQIDNFEIEKKIQELKKLQKLLDFIKINENLVSEEQYYEKVSSLLQVSLLETIDKSQLEQVCSFFENSFTVDNLVDKFQRVRKK